jgi:hypothetical protein
MLSRLAVEPTQPPIQWIPGVKRPGFEPDYSPPTSAEVKKMWIYTSTPPYVFMAWCLISYAQGQFYFTFTISSVIHNDAELTIHSEDMARYQSVRVNFTHAQNEFSDRYVMIVM